MERENKIRLARIIAGALLLAAAFIIQKCVSLALWQYLLIYLVPYFVAGYDVVLEAGENILHGEVFDEDFLMCIATFGALAIGFLPGAEPQFAEAVFIMLFYQVGELFEEIAEGKSRRSVQAIMDLRPDTANVLRNGELVEVDPASVAVGEYIVIRAGERIPLDGVVDEGSSPLDTSALTGESLPRKASPGTRVYSGCIVQSGVLTVRVTSEYANSTVAGILEMMENLPEGKSRRERFITRFARIYTPAVVCAAILLAVIPPLFSGSFSAAFPSYFTRALTFLVVSCPCALVVSVPLAFFGGIGGAASKGVLIKGAAFMESLADLGSVVFDKTGTLTEGVFKVTAVHPEKLDPDSLLHLAAHVEGFSTHPIALSLRQAFGSVCSECSVEDIREYAGEGICARVNGSDVAVGNKKLMRTIGAEVAHCDMCGGYGTVIHVACDGVYAGHVVISDKIKDDAKDAIDGLRTNGVTRTVMLTGDRREVAEFVASKLGVDDFRAELLPADKVLLVKEETSRMSGKRTLAFVGDGINDAPVLACADIGIAMGALGSDAAIEASDVVLMDDKPSKIVFAVKAAKRTLRIAKQNVAFALITKAVILALAVFGFAPLWLAVFGDVGVTVLAVLNSMRALRAVNSEYK